MKKQKIVLAIAALLTVILCLLKPVKEKEQTACNHSAALISTASLE